MQRTLAKKLRLELKFVTKGYNYDLIHYWLKFHNSNFHREYENRIINNIYFDTYSLTSLEENIKEYNKRFKVRYRWFNNFKDKKDGSVEIKSKHNIYGWKNRFHIKNLNITEDKSWKEIKKKILYSVPVNAKIILENYSVPVIINQYYREYFISSDKKFRITIDRNHKNFSQINRFKPNLSKNSELFNSLVLEVKFDKEDEINLKNLLSDIPIKYGKNSKYINGFRSSYGL
jgi:hypothetical protein